MRRLPALSGAAELSSDLVNESGMIATRCSIGDALVELFGEDLFAAAAVAELAAKRHFSHFSQQGDEKELRDELFGGGTVLPVLRLFGSALRKLLRLCEDAAEERCRRGALLSRVAGLARVADIAWRVTFGAGAGRCERG